MFLTLLEISFLSPGLSTSRDQSQTQRTEAFRNPVRNYWSGRKELDRRRIGSVESRRRGEIPTKANPILCASRSNHFFSSFTLSSFVLIYLSFAKPGPSSTTGNSQTKLRQGACSNLVLCLSASPLCNLDTLS